MRNVAELASLLINELQDFINMLSRSIDLDNYRKVYKVVFEIFYQAVNHKSFLLSRDLYKDARLSTVLYRARRILDITTEVTDKHKASVHALAREMLRRAYALLAEAPEDKPRYVIVCDGFSIIDAVFIAFGLKREHMEPFIAPLINSGGITETYKFILEPYNYLQHDNLTLKVIAHKIAEKVRAKDFIVFRGYDDLIHQLRNERAAKILDEMYSLTSKLYSKIVRLKSEFNGMVMLLSDHGYDVIAVDADKYKMEHYWRPNSFSIIAPLLIV
jgi:hypothetical protein